MRAPPSEATTLDERIARDCARSGVPFHVAADHLVDRVAAWVELALEVLDNEERDQRRRATVRHQKGRDREASANTAAVMTPGPAVLGRATEQ